MNGKFSSNNIVNDELIIDTQERDYKNLITRLREIKLKIVLLEKIMFK